MADGGYLKFNSGIKYAHGVRVDNGGDNGNGTTVPKWVTVAFADGDSANDTMSSTFILTMFHVAGQDDAANKWASEQFIVKAKFTYKTSAPYYYSHVTGVTVEPVDGSTLRNWDPSTHIGLKIEMESFHGHT